MSGVWNVAIKSLLARKLRLALTTVAIVLGVAFVTGAFVLGDTINATFDRLFRGVYEGIDVVVRSPASMEGQQVQVAREPLPEPLLDRVREVDGVAVAEGVVQGYAQPVRPDGEPVLTQGAPTLGVNIPTSPELAGQFNLREGRLPQGPGEIVIDAATARGNGIRVGERIKVLFQGPPRFFEVVGIIGFGEADNLAGAVITGFETKTAQEVLGRRGVFDEIDVAAEEGVSAGELRDRVSAAIGPGYEVITGADLSEQAAQEFADTLGNVFTNVLLAFAAVAVFVAGFLIFNTFSIIVAQRARELALLRCMGASRRQVRDMVLLEALAVGVVASVLGVGAGVLLAVGLRALIAAFLGGLPTTSLQLLPRTVAVAVVTGVVATLLASILPARRATRVPPVAALREELAVLPGRSTRRRVALGVLLTALGAALLLTGLFAEVGNRLLAVGAGAAVVFLGVAALSPLVVRPLARVLGWPFARLFGVTGRLAQQNAMRSPRRTASTAAALMVGLALVSFVAILAASLKATAFSTLERSVAADYILTGRNFTGFSPEVAERLRELPELEAVAAVRLGLWQLDGRQQGLMAVDPAAYQAAVRTEVVRGSLDALAGGGVAVSEEVAAERGWEVGDLLAMTFPRGSEQAEIKAIYKDNQVNGDYMVSLATYERWYVEQLDFQVLAKLREGTEPAAARQAIERVLADFPVVTVQDQAEYKEQQAESVNSLLRLFMGLLFLAIVIALLGIVNTLALSVFERVRELGLLRAVGMTRRQVRAMIRWEAVVVAVLGGVLGAAVGTAFALVTLRALEETGVTKVAVPGGQLALAVLATGVAGVLTAVLPARRAAKVDVLRAVTVE